MSKDFQKGLSYLDNIIWQTNNVEINSEINSQKLIPVIVQEQGSKDILMFAWMNPEALAMTIEKRQAVYWSRSRQKLWHKGEESGHVQHIIDIKLDCDGDCLLITVHTKQSIACHTGRHSCFFWQFDFEKNNWNK